MQPFFFFNQQIKSTTFNTVLYNTDPLFSFIHKELPLVYIGYYDCFKIKLHTMNTVLHVYGWFSF